MVVKSPILPVGTMGRAIDHFPDTCPECGLPAYIGAFTIECVGLVCRHGSQKSRDLYVDALLDEAQEEDKSITVKPSISLDFEDEDTEPQLVFAPMFGIAGDGDDS